MNKLTFFISIILFTTNFWSQDSLININSNLPSQKSISIDETSFNNIIAKAKEEGFNLSWGINYDVYVSKVPFVLVNTPPTDIAELADILSVPPLATVKSLKKLPAF